MKKTAAAVLGGIDERLTTQIVEKLDRRRLRNSGRDGPDAGSRRSRRFVQGNSEELLHEMPVRKPMRSAMLESTPRRGGMMNTEVRFSVGRGSRVTKSEWMRKQEVT